MGVRPRAWPPLPFLAGHGPVLRMDPLTALDPLAFYSAKEVALMLKLSLYAVKEYARKGGEHTRGPKKSIKYTAAQIVILRDSFRCGQDPTQAEDAGACSLPSAADLRQAAGARPGTSIPDASYFDLRSTTGRRSS